MANSKKQVAKKIDTKKKDNVVSKSNGKKNNTSNKGKTVSLNKATKTKNSSKNNVKVATTNTNKKKLEEIKLVPVKKTK